MNQQYRIQRVMNNNVILAVETDNATELVLMGKGIGFGRKKGEVVSGKDLTYDKAFKAGTDDSLKDSYLRMLKEVNGNIVEICTEILLEAEKKLGTLSDRSFIVVVDHISFAIEKLDKMIAIENPFVHEIRQLYPEEYAIGEFARKRIQETLEVDITEDEAGFIAMHLHAAKEHVGVKDTLKNTRIIKEITAMIEKETKIDLENFPQERSRMLIHLRGMLGRIDAGTVLSKHPLYGEVARECHEAYGIGAKVEGLLIREKKNPSSSDKFYLTLHIDRLMRVAAETGNND